MLVLRRRERERIIIEVGGEKIILTVTGLERSTVRLGFECGKGVSIHREELYNQIQGEQSARLRTPEGQGGGH